MLDTIRYESVGDLVKVAKYLTGYSPRSEASDFFDADFDEFILDWQERNGLTADGIIGPNTWATMAKKAPTCSTSKNKKSAYVCAIQILIGGLTVDGIFGNNTKRAVSAFQSANKLSVDGICGPKTWNALVVGKLVIDIQPGNGGLVTSDKIINKCVHYLQWDSKWKNVKYSTHTSSQTIGNSGCGPTAMAQIMATFVDPKITPVEMASLAVNNGFRTYDNGTSWNFYPFIFKKYSEFEKYISTTSIETLKSGLGEGALAVCSMNSNDNHFWTSGGHFITAIGYDGEYIYANDPNKETAPRKQLQSKFKTCLKQAFLFWPKKEEPRIEEPKPKEDAPIVNTNTESKAIVDISKWQGSIDFNVLKNQVSLVIARASCGSDKDVMFDKYAKAMNEYRIPFGVYCYSYAGTVEKAEDEAVKMVKYARDYRPLFYVLDAEEQKLTNATIRAFVKTLRDVGIKRVGCYVANHRYKSYDYDSLRDLFDFTWIPSYGSNNGTIAGSKKPSYPCDIWQYSSTARVLGINGNVDVNVITGEGKPLTWFLERV